MKCSHGVRGVCQACKIAPGFSVECYIRSVSGGKCGGRAVKYNLCADHLARLNGEK